MTNLPTAKLKKLHGVLDTAHNKGAALEKFCAEFFGSVPGVTVAESNVLSDAHSQEIDLCSTTTGLKGSGLLGDPFFVEAKNWSSPVGSAEVAWFDWKLRLGGVTGGLLVAANGITGSAADGTSARANVKQASLEGRQIYVVTSDELLACKSSVDFRDLMRTKRRHTATGLAPF